MSDLDAVWRYPTCGKCKRQTKFDFWVPDAVWQDVTGGSPDQLCLDCFDHLASLHNINYSIDKLYFAGEQMTFEFICLGRRDKLGRG